MKLRTLFAFLPVMILTLTACGQQTIPNQQYTIDYSNPDYLHYSEVRSNYFQKETESIDIPSTGDITGLVIPVQFQDYTCDTARKLKQHGGCEGIRTDIQTTLFGDGTGTNWESLASFYKKSSYGKLNITGVVSDWYTAPTTAVEFALTYQDSAAGGAAKMVNDAVEWYKNKHSAEEMKQFDSNSDGYLDAVWLIYSVEEHYQNLNDDLFWAFVYWNQGSIADVDSPNAFSFMWASYNFMYNNGVDDGLGNILPDAHTFIHETGHLLGLTDYYNYDNGDNVHEDISKSGWEAAGGIDMMDFNVGDHNAYSKSLLEWVTPTVVQGNATIKLRPFESSGDCLIIAPEGFTGSIMDEYLILEYYTPTGLNEYDSIHPYAGTYPLTFTEPGIKVYHVDSRLGGFINGLLGADFARYVTELDPRYDYVNIVNENSPSRSGVKDQKLLHLLESSGKNSFYEENKIASNDTLFQEGDSFGYKTFKNYKLQKEVKNGVKAKLGHKFKILSITPEEAIIEIKCA